MIYQDTSVAPPACLVGEKGVEDVKDLKTATFAETKGEGSGVIDSKETVMSDAKLQRMTEEWKLGIDNYLGHSTATRLAMIGEEPIDQRKFPHFHSLISEGNTYKTYAEMRADSESPLPKNLPQINNDEKLLGKKYRKLMSKVRPHEKEIFADAYPKMLSSQDVNILEYLYEPLCIGAGSFGVACLGQMRCDRSLVVIKYYLKVLNKKTLTQSLLREAAIQQEAHSVLPDMVPEIKGFISLKNKGSKFFGYGLVSEFVPRKSGSLTALTLHEATYREMTLAKTGEHLFPKQMYLNLYKRLADGFDTLAKNQIIHNDVKSDNILITYKNGQLYPALIDFGQALCRDTNVAHIPSFKNLTRSDFDDMEKQCPQIAPEVRAGACCSNTDVYGFGWMMYGTGKLLPCKLILDLGAKLMEQEPKKRHDWETVMIALHRVEPKLRATERVRREFGKRKLLRNLY